MFNTKKDKKEGTVTVGIRGRSDDTPIMASERLTEEEQKKASETLK
jgi:hypothetical protein